MISSSFKPEDAHKLMKRCQQDPLFFSTYVLGGEQPWEKQKEIMQSTRQKLRTVVVSGYCNGKTWIAARTVLWFLLSFPHSIVISTAPTARQVENVLWAEIRRQYKDSKLPLGGEVLKTQVKIDDDWFAIGLSTDEPTRFQGFHSRHLLIVFDEAAGVDRIIWDAAEGQMAGAHARWLAIGNPIAPSGPFYEAANGTLWNTINISCLDSPNVTSGRIIYPKLVTTRWIEERKSEWVENSPHYQSKVLGRFPQSSEFGLIPLDWIEKANLRTEAIEPQEGEKRIGVDVARSGADRTVLIYRQGQLVRHVKAYQNINTMETVGRVIRFVKKCEAEWIDVMVDVIGIGAGVVDRLHEQGFGVCGVNFGDKMCNKKRFANTRAQCYWMLKEALNPESENPLAIPKKPTSLCSELAAIEWSADSAGHIKIEPKEDVKKRLGRSPDYADALALTYVRPVRRLLYEMSGRGKYKRRFNV